MSFLYAGLFGQPHGWASVPFIYAPLLVFPHSPPARPPPAHPGDTKGTPNEHPGLDTGAGCLVRTGFQTKPHRSSDSSPGSERRMFDKTPIADLGRSALGLAGLIRDGRRPYKAPALLEPDRAGPHSLRFSRPPDHSACGSPAHTNRKITHTPCASPAYTMVGFSGFAVPQFWDVTRFRCLRLCQCQCLCHCQRPYQCMCRCPFLCRWRCLSVSVPVSVPVAVPASVPVPASGPVSVAVPVYAPVSDSGSVKLPGK